MTTSLDSGRALFLSGAHGRYDGGVWLEQVRTAAFLGEITASEAVELVVGADSQFAADENEQLRDENTELRDALDELREKLNDALNN